MKHWSMLMLMYPKARPTSLFYNKNKLLHQLNRTEYTAAIHHKIRPVLSVGQDISLLITLSIDGYKDKKRERERDYLLFLYKWSRVNWKSLLFYIVSLLLAMRNNQVRFREIVSCSLQLMQK